MTYADVLKIVDCHDTNGEFWSKVRMAVDKQILKKPIEWGYKKIPICPTCNRVEYIVRRDGMDTCCGFCGQAIDWRVD